MKKLVFLILFNLVFLPKTFSQTVIHTEAFEGTDFDGYSIGNADTEADYSSQTFVISGADRVSRGLVGRPIEIGARVNMPDSHEEFAIAVTDVYESSNTLNAGDIAFVGYHTDSDDGFTFIALTDIPAGEVIYFTDKGWNATNAVWYSNAEDHIVWTSPAGGTSIGTVVSIIETSGDTFTVSHGTAALSGTDSGFSMLGGDSILAYQSSSGAQPTNPTFIAGIYGDDNYVHTVGCDDAGGWLSCSTCTHISGSCSTTSGDTSGMPAGLTNGENAIALFPNTGEEDNAKYTGTLTGSVSDVRAAIHNPANWTTNDSPINIASTEYSGINITPDVSNNAPVIGGASAGQTVNDNATISPFSGIAIADADGDNLTATITLDNNAKGIITGASSGSGPYTITSRTPAAMQTALRALVFNPTDNRTATSETTTFTIVVNDGTDTDTDNTTTVIASAVAPTVTSVSSSTGNGTYKVGDAIAVTVTFSESVTVTGSLQLTLETGSVDRVINYTSGTGSSTLTFSYTVQAGDNNADLDYVATNSLGLNGGTIKDAGGKDAILTLAIPGAANSLGANKALVIDGIVPTVTSVSSTTGNGTYKVGDAVAITVTFSEAVTVTGTPQITLETGTTDRTVNYFSGSGGSTLTFNYIVQAGDVSSDLDYVATNSLALNGGTIKDGAGNDATLTLATPGAANSLGANKALVIDGIAPTVTSVSSSTNNGTYKVGDAVAVTVTFSESVTVTGTPQITLETGTTDRAADYTSGSGSNTLTFNYTVQSGDVSADLDYVATTSLALNSGTIKDASGNNATLTLATPGAANSLGANKALVIDAVAPVITSLGLHNGNTFVEIFASEGLYNTNGGSGALEISDIAISISGGTATNPVISSLKKVDGTTDLTGGENIIRVTFTTTGVADGSEVVKIDFADGSSVFDAAGNAASATQSNNTRTLNDLIKPNITGVSLAADNSYIDVTFNEGVYEDNCTGGGLQASDFNLSISNGTATTPVISSVKKNDNTAEGSATALAGGETVVRIFFSVTGTPDGAETLEVDLQANAVFDQNGLTADANQTSNNTASLNDKVVPTVLEVTSNATNGTFKVGDNINIYVQYSEEVLVTGTPQLELETGTTDRTINYVDRSVSTLRFVYTVQAGDVSADLDVTSSTALSLNGGTIKDAAGNNASLTVQQGTTGGSLAWNKAIVIDGVVPTVTSVSSTTANGTYKAGDAIAVTVTFSEAVTVTGTPQITLETGTTDRTVNYASGSGSATLTFNYTVQSGDSNVDLDYVATNSLTLNSGTIKDASGNDAALTLATPGAANSLGANKAIVIDAVSPTVTSVSVPSNGSNAVNSFMTFTVNTSENVIVNTTSGTPQIAITIGSNTRQAVFHSNSGTQALVFRYRVVAGDEDTDGITVGALDLNGGTMKDAAGNDLITTLNSVGATTSVLVDGIVPTITSVSSTKADGAYKVGEVIGITVTFSEAVDMNLGCGGSPYITLETGGTDRDVDYSSGSGTNTLTFNYTVQAGDTNSDLDYVATTSLVSNGSIVTDAAGNDAVLTLPVPGAANSLGANKAIVIDGIAPTLTSVSSTKADGSYGLGESIPITVTFDEAVTVTGTPQLELETGVVDRKVDYSSGTGTNTLTFNYTVQMGDESADLDYKATNALTLNGGTIKDAAGNDATLTLAAPGAANSLGNNKALVVEAFPTVTLSVGSTSIAEASGTSTVTATLSAISSQDVTVSLAYSGTATNGIDYNVTASTSITVPAGNLSANAAVGITSNDDVVEEGSETIIIDIVGVTKGTENGIQNATITLTDDDDNTAPSGFTITLSDALIAASETATTKFTFAGAEVGTTYNYTVSSNNGGANVTGTGTIATATDEITINDLSGLNDGTLTLSVTLTDGSSNTSSAQTATSQLDKTAPAAPVVTGVSADSGSSSSDGVTSDTTPDVKGTAEANATIEVFVGGNSVGTTSADGSGDWTLAYSGVNPLADGTISVTAKATDAAGNTSTASTAVNVTIDATAPAAPVITSITPDSGTSTTDKITNDQTNLTITGTGEANSQLEITVNGVTYSGLPVDGSGNWSIAVGAILGTDGTYPVTATVTDAAGNQSAASAAFSIIYDTTAPAAPTVDLNAASDLGQSNTDNITHYNATDGLMLSGTAEANAAIELSLTYNGTTFSGLTAAADGSGNWTFDAGAIVSGVIANGTVNNLVISAKATDAAGNQGAAGTLTVVLDQQMTATLSPADNAVDILPSANLTMAFGEDVFKGTGNITIKKKSDDSTIETIPVSAVTISSGTVTIDPVNLILPPATEFYINIDAGALTDIAGNSYAISNNTDWSFTIIASSVVTSVAVPANNTYKIGDELGFTASFTLPITITGTPSIPVTIGASTKTASLKAAVNNSNTAIFSYTIAEGDLDTDGIALGTAISLNGGTIKDQFGTDAQLALNNVAATTSINVDGVRPVPTLTTSATTLVNGKFTVEFTFSEAVTGFTLADITVANGTASNFTTITAGTKWSAEITPTADGTVSASLAAGVANDNAGNASAAGAAVSKTYDGTAPTALSLTRKTANPILTASAGFRVTFSEEVTGVDLIDFEVILTGTATGTLNAITQVDAKTYDVTVTGISGQGSIGLNLKDDDSIIDAANNPLSGALTGEVYVTNMLPTDIALAPSAIDENNALSAEVGTLSTTDTDATDTHSYSLIAGTGDTDNGSFMVAGNKLFAGAAFNHEVKDSYSIRLQTEDNNGGRFEKAFTITINDVNEAPTDISLSNNVIDEADDAGVLVGTMASVDQDAAETFTYTLATGTGDDNNLLFTFTGDELRTATPINFESNTTLSIRVKVTDSGGLSYEEVFSITVNNVELEEIRNFTKDAPDARIKNFFSPNGDGINDLWVIDDILDNPINEVKVFSQNGTLIFSERNYKNTWDGTYKGESIPPGTYYYEINVYNGEQIVRGFLTIIRTKN